MQINRIPETVKGPGQSVRPMQVSGGGHALQMSPWYGNKQENMRHSIKYGGLNHESSA